MALITDLLRSTKLLVASYLKGGNSTTQFGAIPFQSNVDVTSLLLPNTTTTKKFVRMTGDGTNGAYPEWDTLAQADISGLKVSDSPAFAGATIGSLAGIIKGAAGILSAQAIGAANTKLFVDAAGTGYEWAKGFKVITVSRDSSTASGTQAVTGAGFKPGFALIIGGYFGGASFSFGFDDAVSPQSGWYLGSWAVGAGQSSVIGIDTSNYNVAKINSMDADGCTLGWTKVGSPTGTCYLLVAFFR